MNNNVSKVKRTLIPNLTSIYSQHLKHAEKNQKPKTVRSPNLQMQDRKKDQGMSLLRIRRWTADRDKSILPSSKRTLEQLLQEEVQENNQTDV